MVVAVVAFGVVVTGFLVVSGRIGLIVGIISGRTVPEEKSLDLM